MNETIQLNGIKTDLESELEIKTRENQELRTTLEKLTGEMNQFTYIVSHDLQAPLRTITGFMELLVKRYSDKLDDTAMQYINYAVKGTAKMKNLVFDLLEYSRLNTSIKERTETNLNDVMGEVKGKYISVIENSGATLRIDDLPLVNASRKQMVQIFGHLLENALKFRSEVTPEINISSRRDNDNWIISVKDNGLGIDPAFFEKIFIVFRRLHNDETKYSGTGIGLALCKKIAELHGGNIWVESVTGGGSTFYFTLPAMK